MLECRNAENVEITRTWCGRGDRILNGFDIPALRHPGIASVNAHAPNGNGRSGSGRFLFTEGARSRLPRQPGTTEVSVVRGLPVDGTQQVQRLDDPGGTHVEGLADEVLGGLVVAGAERLDEQRGR